MPRVSCLTVTLGTLERLPMLARAIEDYLAQTHADRELIVVTDVAGESPALDSLVGSFERDDIRLLRVAKGTLGALRNHSVTAADGEFVCQWDDDDRHHPRRIGEQLGAMERAGADAVVLQDVLSYRPDAATLHWLNWAGTPAGGHPGTLLARRAAMPAYAEAGPNARLGEDLDLLARLEAAGPVHRLGGMPHLYLYASHGANSWPAAHHVLLGDSLAISAGLLRWREAMLRAGLVPFALGGISVEGANGAAFRL